eukprot:13607583-Alexandrium_andersonii.AAC.1
MLTFGGPRHSSRLHGACGQGRLWPGTCPSARANQAHQAPRSLGAACVGAPLRPARYGLPS